MEVLKSENKCKRDGYNFEEINNQVNSILENIDYDIKDNLIEILDLILDNTDSFIENKKNTFTKRFSNNEYIRLILNGKELSLDMIQRPGNGIDSMLRVFLFAFENDVSKIIGKAQPQKNNNPFKYERRRKILLKFYSDFGFKINDTSTGKMSMELNDENTEVLLNKIKYYIDNGKWFSL